MARLSTMNTSASTRTLMTRPQEASKQGHARGEDAVELRHQAAQVHLPHGTGVGLMEPKGRGGEDESGLGWKVGRQPTVAASGKVGSNAKHSAELLLAP